jgi:hypothetical protein
MTTTDVEVFQTAPQGLAFRYTPAELQTWSLGLVDLVRAVLIEGTDYGVIPGTPRPSLYKPGAEKLQMIAGYAIHEDRMPSPGEADGVTYRYTALRPDPGIHWKCGVCTEEFNGIPVGQVEGYAGYDEDRFFQPGAQRRAEAEKRERANAVRYQRSVNPRKWEDIPETDYRAPLNSVMKMAQKRSHVGCILNAMSASGLFTQDLEDAQPEAAVVEAYDAMTHLGPFLAELTPEEIKALGDWRKSEDMPAPRSMTAPDVERTLVRIGMLVGLRGPQEVSAPQPSQSPIGAPGAAVAPTEAPQTGEDDGGAPFDTGPQPSLPGSGPTVLDDSDEPEFARGLNLAKAVPSEAPLATSQSGPAATPSAQPSSSVPVAEAVEARQATLAKLRADVAAVPPEPDQGRVVSSAQHFHRRAGAMGLDKATQEAVVLLASNGRTTHAGECGDDELPFATLLLNQVEGGHQTAAMLLEAGVEMRKAQVKA